MIWFPIKHSSIANAESELRPLQWCALLCKVWMPLLPLMAWLQVPWSWRSTCLSQVRSSQGKMHISIASLLLCSVCVYSSPYSLCCRYQKYSQSIDYLDAIVKDIISKAQGGWHWRRCYWPSGKHDAITATGRAWKLQSGNNSVFHGYEKKVNCHFQSTSSHFTK